MLFNSIDFAIFLPLIFLLYWFILKKDLKLQNILIVAGSYVFYGWWDWKFLSLIIFSTIVDYFIALGLSKENNNKKRKILLWTSLAVNIGILGFFKYYNFFIESFIDAFSIFGQEFKITTLSIILPVGISFYTFQTLSYTIDVYKRKLEPTKNFLAFAAFVSFFPQLVAGPIERAKNLLPQFLKKRKFEYSKAADGMRQILWGLFKKVVIADNCAVFVNQIFENYTDHSAPTLIVGAIFFAFQIYGDFSGYSDIAIGTARLFGFNLMKNFAFPYFSRDIAEFWRRWHISLSTWFRDYLYIPLGGSRGGTAMKVRNTFIIFVVSGFWHGANWTFIIWGALNALYFLPLLLMNKNRQNIEVVAQGKFFPKVKDIFNISLTFTITVIAWIFFRAENINHALGYIKRILFNIDFSFPISIPIPLLLFIVFFLTIEWIQRDQEHGLDFSKRKVPLSGKWALYLIVGFFVATFFGVANTFIYFQF